MAGPATNENELVADHSTTMEDVSAATWENHKENAAPLERGRSVAALEYVMTQTEKDGLIQEFEHRVQATNDFADWMRYIKWFQDYCTSDTHGLFLLLERCYRKFSEDSQLADDPRFIRLCCLYADKTREPIVTFQEVYRAGIGHTSAVFWNAWAFIAEKAQDFRMAEKIFIKGLQKRAQPVEYLLLRQKRFQRRMSRHFLNSIHAADEEEADQRGNFASISRADASVNSRRGTAPSTFSVRASRPVQRLGNNGLDTIDVYQDDDVNNDSFAIFQGTSEPVPQREPEIERWKENTAKTEKWNDRRHGPVVPRMASTGAFAIHIDDHCAQENARIEDERQKLEAQHRRARDDRQGPASRGSRKPKHMWNDELLRGPNGEEQSFEEARLLRRCFRLAPASSAVNLLSAPNTNVDDSDMSLSFEEHDDNAVASCSIVSRKDIHLETVGGDLMSRFDQEDRVHQTVQCHNTGVLASKRSRDDDPPSIATLETVGGNLMSRFGQVDEMGSKTTPRNAMISTGKQTPTPHNASNCSSTVDEVARIPTEPTINTQLALKEISVMFLSPAATREDRSVVGGTVMDESTHLRLQNSILEEDDAEQQENKDAPQNPNARANTMPGFHAAALRSLKQDDGTGTRCTTSRGVGRIDQANPLRGLQEHDIAPDPGFTIFDDEQQPAAPGPGFVVLDEQPQPAAVASGFSIFQDVNGTPELQRPGNPRRLNTGRGMYIRFQ